MKTHLLLTLITALALARPASAISPAELRALLGAGERVTLIDLRPREAYEAGTLPDAMRMTAREAQQKPLTGRVVFFDDGTGPNLARRSVAQLTEKNAKVQADALAGGYAAWCDAGGATSERKGLRPALTRYVTYGEVTGPLTEDAADVVLVDLRPAPQRAAASAAMPDAPVQTPDAPAQTPVDLAAELPGYTVTRTLPGSAPQRQAASSGQAGNVSAAAPLYVLIDAGDGSAERAAQTLKASGISRVAVLAGGETVIRRKGEPGLLRRGPGNGLATDKTDGSSPFATVVDEEVKP